MKAPLEDVRVIAVEQFGAGPWSTLQLADHYLGPGPAQAAARIDFGREDKVFNVLPVFHSFGLTVGVMVPLVFAIGILVFLGAFVPVVGAAASGSVAVLVALVAHGPIVALVMLAGVIAVQQLEAHVLQPFLLGRFVAVHPLAVILAIAAGVLVAGIPGALVAVPLVAALNAIVLHLAATAGPEPEPEPAPEPPQAQPPPETTEGPDATSTSRPS